MLAKPSSYLSDTQLFVYDAIVNQVCIIIL